MTRFQVTNVSRVLALGGLCVAGALCHSSDASKQGAIRDSYDYVIVGGGTSGLTVGNRLSESGKCKFHAYPGYLLLSITLWSHMVYRGT